MNILKLPDIRDVVAISTDQRKREEGIEVYLPKSAESLLKYLQKENPLYVRISALNNIAKSELCALMWLGRDYADDEEYDWNSLLSYANRIESIYIAEKSPLPEYLLRGLNILGLSSDYKSYCVELKRKKRSRLYALSEFTPELYRYLTTNPNSLYSFSPRRFEELINDILRNMGYETHLTKQTRDGGRDILAYFSTPLGKILMIVDCKRYAPNRKIGVDIVERFLYVVDRKDDASMGMLVTTSSFSQDALGIEKQRPFRLMLKDFNNIKDWLDADGKRYEKNRSGLWLPED